MKVLSILCLSLFVKTIFSQVSINNSLNPPHGSAMLDVSAIDKGLLLPRMTLSQRNAITSPAPSLLIYQTDNNPGYYYNAGSSASPNWQAINSQNAGYKIPITSLPLTINTPGSYILTADFTVSSGITINVSSVSIDLNQYTIKGGPGNTGSGIKINGSQQNVNIYNGKIESWSESGIDATTANNSQFYTLQLTNNGEDGITTGTNAILNAVAAKGNSFNGIFCGSGSLISSCIATANQGNGIETGANSIVLECIGENNQLNGIKIGNASTLTSGTANGNTNHGISTGTTAKVIRCNSFNNTQSGIFLGAAGYAEGNTSRLNGKHGYELSGDVVVKNNAADDNVQHGFYSIFTGGLLESNSSTDNAIGIYISSSGWLIVKNASGSNATAAYSISGGNTTGPIINSAGMAANTNPNANIEY